MIRHAPQAGRSTTMTIRVVQAGSGPVRDVVALFLVGNHRKPDGTWSDDDLRAAMGPEACILADATADGLERYSDILQRAQNAAGEPIELGRVTLAGWSRGCARVRALWAAGARPDMTLLLDGTHAAHPPRPEQLAAWRLITDAGRSGACRVVATCTSMTYTERLPASEGGPFASTLTVLRALTGWRLDAPLDGNMEGGLVVLKFPSGDIDAAAHVRQQRVVLPQLLAYYAARGGEGAELPDLEDRPEAPDFSAAVLDAARADLLAGVAEQGKNRGAVIDDALRAVGVEPPGDWCAAMVARWMREAAKATGLPSPIAGSAGAQATAAQFRAAGLFTEARDLRPEDLSPGCVPVWRRPPIDWHGHLGVGDTHLVDGRFWCVEGNSGAAGDRVARMPERLDDPLLLGVGRFG